MYILSIRSPRKQRIRYICTLCFALQSPRMLCLSWTSSILIYHVATYIIYYNYDFVCKMSIAPFLGSAGRKWQKEDKSITCYDCNSLYDPRCADPFDPYSLGYVNCSLRDIPEHLKDKYSRSVLCRKTIQKGKTRHA